MKKYEIWVADLDPNFGTETGKIRPVVIVQNDFMNGKHDSTVICPITTKLRPTSILLRVSLHEPINGLSKPSEIMVDQIRTIDNRRFVKKLGILDPNSKTELIDRLKKMLEI